MTQDELYMQRCLDLAARGSGSTAPNPMVGAVLVFDNKIIGEGWHQQFGGPHAEVNCINSVAEIDQINIKNATLYVSLEPCAHFGKTPPCSDLIIVNNITKVVIGCIDSFSKVSGRGIQKLKDAGVEVIVGILESDCLALNKRFFYFYKHLKPYIILKWAQSLDGFIAPTGGKKVFLSNVQSQLWVHKMRSEEAGILVGYNTAKIDNPYLNNRHFGSTQPVRIVLDFNLELSDELHIFEPSQKTIVFNYHKEYLNNNISYVKIKASQDYISQILHRLYTLQIMSVIIEGGRKTLQAFIDAQTWQEAIIIEAPIFIENGVAAPILKHAKLVYEAQLNKDIIKTFLPI